MKNFFKQDNRKSDDAEENATVTIYDKLSMSETEDADVDVVDDEGVDGDASSASSASTSPSLRLHYQVGGRGDHPVLLLPGALGSTKTDFEPQLRLMKDDQHLGLVAWDPRVRN